MWQNVNLVLISEHNEKTKELKSYSCPFRKSPLFLQPTPEVDQATVARRFFFPSTAIQQAIYFQKGEVLTEEI